MKKNDERQTAEVFDRLPYEPPAVEESATFETLALTCGKTDPQAAIGCDPDFGGTLNAS